MNPLITCITPITKSREHFEKRCNEIIASQDYQNIEHLYIREEGLTIGAKRNIGCERAKGEIIVHIDSDDNYKSDWVSSQVKLLLSSNADICGLSELYFYDQQTNKAWKYIWNIVDGNWIAGATMCYYKSFWERNKFQDIQVGEDSNFIWKPGVKIVTSDYINGFVAILHGDNTAPHNKSYRWNLIDSREIENILNK